MTDPFNIQALVDSSIGNLDLNEIQAADAEQTGGDTAQVGEQTNTQAGAQDQDTTVATNNEAGDGGDGGIAVGGSADGGDGVGLGGTSSIDQEGETNINFGNNDSSGSGQGGDGGEGGDADASGGDGGNADADVDVSAAQGLEQDSALAFAQENGQDFNSTQDQESNDEVDLSSFFA